MDVDLSPRDRTADIHVLTALPKMRIEANAPDLPDVLGLALHCAPKIARRLVARFSPDLLHGNDDISGSQLRAGKKRKSLIRRGCVSLRERAWVDATGAHRHLSSGQLALDSN